VDGPETARPGHVGHVRRLELVGDVHPVQVDGQARRRVTALAETADRYRAALGQAQRHDRPARVGGIARRRRRPLRLGQTSVSYEVDPLHRRCTLHTRGSAIAQYRCMAAQRPD